MSIVEENLRYLKARLKSIPLPSRLRAFIAADNTDAAFAPLPHDATHLDKWRARHPRLEKTIRIAGIVLAVYLVLPYFLVLVYRFIDPPFSALMLRQALTGTYIRHQWVSLDEISKNLPRTVITSEDASFCQHWGVDWNAVQDAIEEADEGDIPRGASTIPMQTAKNLFLWNGQTYLRKALEIPLAYWISFIWPKWRVMEVYLNIAEWGPGIFGAEAAARYHFGKHAADLTESEAALLAASLPNPIVRHPGKPGPKLRNLAARLQGRVSREGNITACLAD